jgi:hypothetical protein
MPRAAMQHVVLLRAGVMLGLWAMFAKHDMLC